MTLSNGFVQVQVDTTLGQLVSQNVHDPSCTHLTCTTQVSAIGDFSGEGHFPPASNALATPWALESVSLVGIVARHSGVPTVTVLSNTSDVVSVKLAGISDNGANPSALEDWVVTLNKGARGFELNVTGKITGKTALVVAVQHSSVFAAQSIYGLFDRGAVQQMLCKTPQMFGSVDRLASLYALGGGTAIELLRTTAAIGQQTVLLSSPKGFPQGSGFRDVHVGELVAQDVWGDGGYKTAVSSCQLFCLRHL